MKTFMRVIFVLSAGFFLSGCFATGQDVQDLKIQIARLSDTLSSVQANQAGISVSMEELSRDISISSENLRDLDDQLSRLSSRIDDITIALADTAHAASDRTKKKVMFPSELYEEAQANFIKGFYEAAEEGFNLYLENYPKGEYVEKSRYALGDIYFAQGKHQDAAVAYAKLMQAYPKSKSTPSYRLKYARAILPLNKKTEARKYLNSIIQDYPKLPEAKLAREELAKIK